MVNTLGPHALAVAGPIALVAGHPGVVLEPLLLPVPGVKAQPVPGVVVGGVGHPVDHSSLLLTHTRLAQYSVELGFTGFLSKEFPIHVFTPWQTNND